MQTLAESGAAGTSENVAPRPHLPDVEYVDFGRRLAARLIDWVAHVVIGLASGVVVVILAYVVEGATGRSAQLAIDRLETGGLQAFLFGLLGSFLYDTVMEGLHGSTVGKLAVGITVLKESTRPCTLAAAAKRSLLFFYDSLFFGLVAEHSMKQSPRLQRYGDRWADTIVVRRRSQVVSHRRSFLRFTFVLVLAVTVDGLVLSAPALMALVA